MSKEKVNKQVVECLCHFKCVAIVAEGRMCNRVSSGDGDLSVERDVRHLDEI